MEFCKKHPDVKKPCRRCSAEWSHRRIRAAVAKGEVIPGRRAKFRGKNRTKPIQVYLTDNGRAALMAGCQRTGLSRPDYIEKLVLEDQRKASP